MTVPRRSSASVSAGSWVQCMLTGWLPDGNIASRKTRRNSMRNFVVAALAALAALPAAAEQKLDFILNWVPGGDHAPYYYAKAQGWYAKEGIDLNLEPG